MLNIIIPSERIFSLKLKILFHFIKITYSFLFCYKAFGHHHRCGFLILKPCLLPEGIYFRTPVCFEKEKLCDIISIASF